MPNNTSSHTPTIFEVYEGNEVNLAQIRETGPTRALVAEMQQRGPEAEKIALLFASAPTLAAELEKVKAQLAALTISLDTSIDTNGLLREELRREHSSVMALGPELASSMNEISRLKSLNSELVEALTALHRTIISLSEQSDTNALDRLEIIRRDNEPTIQKARAALAKSEKGI